MRTESRFRIVTAVIVFAFATRADAATGSDADKFRDAALRQTFGGASPPAPKAEGCAPARSIDNDPRMVWAPSALKVAPTHNLQIGSTASRTPADFSSVWGAAQLSGSGRIAVVDYESKEVRIFSGTGQHVKTVGGSGQGPGEFRDPRLVPVAGRYDSIVIVDSPASRVTAFSSEGVLTSTLRTGRLPGARMIGFLSNGRLINQSRPFGGVSGSRSESSIRFQIDDVKMLVLNRDSVRNIQIAYDSTPSIAIILPATPNTIYGGAWIPFRVQTSTAATSNSVVSTVGSKAVIREFDSSGCLARLINVAGPLRSVPAGEYERWIEWGISRVPSKDVARRLYAQVPRPSGLPAWQKLVVDSEGFVWAEVFRVQDDSTSPPRWNVFAPDGRTAGTVTLPDRVDVVQVGRNFILGIWTGADDIQFVRRYSLTRTP